MLPSEKKFLTAIPFRNNDVLLLVKVHYNALNQERMKIDHMLKRDVKICAYSLHSSYSVLPNYFND